MFRTVMAHFAHTAKQRHMYTSWNRLGLCFVCCGYVLLREGAPKPGAVWVPAKCAIALYILVHQNASACRTLGPWSHLGGPGTASGGFPSRTAFPRFWQRGPKGDWLISDDFLRPENIMTQFHPIRTKPLGNEGSFLWLAFCNRFCKNVQKCSQK